MTNILIRGRMENSEEEAEAGVTLKECQLRLEKLDKSRKDSPLDSPEGV